MSGSPLLELKTSGHNMKVFGTLSHSQHGSELFDFSNMVNV